MTTTFEPIADPLAAATVAPAEVQAATGGRLVLGDGLVEAAPFALNRIAIDSRQVHSGDVFWALPGEHRNGADFAAEAYRRGAVGVIGPPTVAPAPGAWALQVREPLAALFAMARHRRQLFTGTSIGVTGSVGKSTTRQMLHATLSSTLPGVASPHNYNTPVGVSLSLLRLHRDHRFGVFELAARRAGQIAELADMAAPSIGVITNIGEAHLGIFGSQRAIAHAKAELLEALPADGLAVLNGDDPWLRRMAGKSRARVVWVGRRGDCDVTANNVSSCEGTLRFEVEGHALQVPAWGRHHLTAALASVAVARAMGLNWDRIARGLRTFRTLPMRCEVFRAAGLTVINDTYNASPHSMRAALDVLRESDAPGRRVLVCGDMAELGDRSAQLHETLGREVVTQCGPDLLVACGQYADIVVEAARSAGMPARQARACRQAGEVVALLSQSLRSGDIVLFKGSRNMALERLVDHLGLRPAKTEETTINRQETFEAPPQVSDLREFDTTHPPG